MLIEHFELQIEDGEAKREAIVNTKIKGKD